MRYRALVTLCACFGVFTEAGALPVNNSGYQGAANYAQQGAAPADNAIYEVLGRLEQLQSEVQQLRGMVEEQAQTIADLERKQSNMYSDLDGRVQALTPAGGQPQTPAAAQAPQAGAEAAPVQPQPAATSAATAPVVAQPAAPVQAAPVAAAPAPVAETKPATSTPSAQGNEKERYQAAYDTLRNGHNAQAERMFEALLADFPAGETADNAQYWLAEAYKMNREYDKARGAFGKVVSQYPNSSKVPDALLKLGYIELDQQNVAKGRDYLTRVVTSYPGTTAAHLASKRLAQMPQ
ncbi:MAG: tol-pal system protein YbgF [Methylococcaceae bacterium]|nr:tol-pal system protein YbgF [Methylococcaceae bacterium]